MSPQKIGKMLKDARLAIKQKQSDVAKIVDLNTNYYARIERDEVVPSIKTLKKIMKVLKIPSSDNFLLRFFASIK